MKQRSREDTEPRWPALMAMLAIGFLNLALPASLVVGPRWLVLVVVGVLAVPTVAFHRVGNHALNRFFGTAINVTVTVALIGSLLLLIRALPTHKEEPIQLLISAASLWVSNVLAFASWYWRLDGGGPHARDKNDFHTDGAFLFPQMALHPGTPAGAEMEPWTPDFVDYLFLAFNTSTALSPTDTQVLSRWAKLLMMLQSSISLTIIVLLAARGVNIL